ncbi:histone H3-K4 methyltransferase Set1 [Suhomyces tanzawaensis NRRL Y-17324]|uniref:Histone-lysine N-methyltransferase, H3 lysine-4 specific n=1 Tax=Suhomyces tanzawaensis NRRL Y-17324 TaxID=984487 RepID=A0A1E4SJ32_9ASCO|nr:histone H3-K4 methyltransferase Set1 [Suhomyces tanzawaensis NRRL Y-17324]ODV79447.1 histone H3-K4 methyltransferase Set1 [Suhomyces tanzawaensis NRRL Y-17324]
MSYNNHRGYGNAYPPSGYSQKPWKRSRYPDQRDEDSRSSSSYSGRYHSEYNSHTPSEYPPSPSSRGIKAAIASNGSTPLGTASAGTPRNQSTPDARLGNEEPAGTDPKTGQNSHDSKFLKLMHHVDFSVPKETRSSDPSKNYKVMYDPELDPTLSKAERKSKQRKLRFKGDGVSSSQVIDPRKTNIAQYFQKPNKRTKKFPFKQLPQSKFVFDKDSLGPPPQTELVVWDLPATTSEVYLENYFRSYGDPIKDMKFINDPINAVPLGVGTFKFQGNPEKAQRLAKKLIQTLKAERAKIDGVEIRIGLNDHDGELLQKRIDSANEKLRIAKNKRAEEDKRRLKRQLEEEQRRHEEQKRIDEENRKIEALKKAEAAATLKVEKFQPNSTMVSIRHNNKVVPGVFLPSDLKKYIKERPYILIHDRYIPTKRIPSQDLKRALNKYDWTRILSDKTGFFIVFNSLNEAKRCFFNEDGRKFYEYKMYMELAVPEGFNRSSDNEDDEGIQAKTRKNDLVDEGVNMLIKEFQMYLSKDIRERIIAPVVLDLLGHDKYPELVESLKAKEAAMKVTAPVVSSNGYLKQNALSLLAKQRKQQQAQTSLPSFKKKIERPKVKRNLIPMQHALNYDRESESESDDDEEDSSRSVTPVASKRDRSSALTSPDDEEEIEAKKHKKTKLQKSFLYESESSSEVEEDAGEEVVDEAADENEIDYSTIEEQYQPTETPSTVFPESELLPTEVFDLEVLQDVIKDDEDMSLAMKVLEEVKPEPIPNMEYWAWKQMDTRNASEEIAEDVDLIESLDPRLECSSGSFRSEGQRQIADADKIEYLPHRRKIHKPLKTVQHDFEEEEEVSNNNSTSTSTNNVQSSRVNRAKNRRFAADITAQIGTESEVLSLNTLTKRKKPVSFARSAIHNWGLYAMEPIAAKEMIIEYVGESIRQQVAEHREKSYLKTGIGSSYLFRVDENTVIDATKKGGIARFINHCCNPSCTAKIIKVEGKKRIVIYALRDIDANEELTYDYKFERETNDEERIRCLCGAPGCKGWLN